MNTENELARRIASAIDSSMNKILLIPVTLAFSLALATAQSTNSETKKLTPTEAKDFVGKHSTVVGKVANVRALEKITHINFEKPFPNQPFSAVVFASKTNLFPNLDKLPGRTVEVTGKIEDYNGKPQIVLQMKGQLKVLPDANSEKSETNGDASKSDK